MRFFFGVLMLWVTAVSVSAERWVRINQLGYLPSDRKVAVLLCDDEVQPEAFEVVDVFTRQTVLRSTWLRPMGPLGQMKQTYRLDFSSLRKDGTYVVKVGNAQSPHFPIACNAYDGTADFLLNYMRQQRCGYNPYLRDSCHQHDGYIVGHPMKEGQYIDVRGGWHDATDQLQYVSTSANAVYQMMLAYEQHPESFGDAYGRNGMPGANGVPDVIDEIAWGIEWLLKMNPAPGELYNQVADDRDHVGLRFPNKDKADYGYGPGKGRAVWYCSGATQQMGKFKNATTGKASTAGKFASAFALGKRVLQPFYPDLARQLEQKAMEAYATGQEFPGRVQTTSVRSPYIYEEWNWTDDMELGAVELYRLRRDPSYLEAAQNYGRLETFTPWMGTDTARHYQWYPFMNAAHWRIATETQGKERKEFIAYLKQGIAQVWDRARTSPFLYGIPPIWCSNNLTTAMLTQCIFYRTLTGDCQYEELEAALRDWLFGCNPWGTSMVVELPIGGIYPMQPHSIWNRLMKKGHTKGGLVDGPVYSSIFGSLIGVSLEGAEAYEHFQPGTMVYHDGYHDYSTNEPTIDGTACLIYPLSYYASEGRKGAKRKVADRNVYYAGGIVRGDPQRKRICLVFTAADKADGADIILPTLKKRGIKGGFFFTGEFYEKFPHVIRQLVKDGHYVGSHSYGHLLYSSWEDRDSMLVSHEEFCQDMEHSYELMAKFGIRKEDTRYFIPPYEHYNERVSGWARQMGLHIMNYTQGTGTNADYTIPSMKSYRDSETLYRRLMDYEREYGLNGHFLMVHFGTRQDRTDKFYALLPEIIDELKGRGYKFVGVKEMIEH